MVRLVAPAAMSLLAASIVGSVVAHDVGPDVKQLVNRFESRYRSARTLQATFLERYSENGHLVGAEAGTAYFRRPGKMRWEYEAPEKNLFLVDGKTVWFYVPADHTATRVPAKVSTDWRTPLALLAGEMKVSRLCARVQFATHEEIESPGDVMLRCEPRGAGNKSKEPKPSETMTPGGKAGEAIFFEIAKTTGALVRVAVRDPGGVRIEFLFANWQADPPVDDSLFHFHAPAGVAIVNGELPGESGTTP